MSWVRIDDQMADHPKLREVGAIGLAIQTAAICYCGRYLTDGFLSTAAADILIQTVLLPLLDPIRHNQDVVETSASRRAAAETRAAANEAGRPQTWNMIFTSGSATLRAGDFGWAQMMVRAGLWERAEGGYTVHDYLEYNPPRIQVLAAREQRREAGKKGAEKTNRARWGDRRNPREGVGEPPTGRRPVSDDNVVGETSPPSPTPSPNIHSSSKNGKKIVSETVDSAQTGSIEPEITQRDVQNAWIEMVNEYQVEKWGKIVLSPSQINMLVARVKQRRDINPGFRQYYGLMMAIKHIPDKLDNPFTYLKKLANEERAVEMYLREGEKEIEVPQIVRDLYRQKGLEFPKNLERVV